MQLSSDLISQFVKATKDDKKTPNETTVYGTVVYDGKPYVKLDGSDLLTPVTTTTDVQDGERVTVMIKNHTATVTGNISSPSARTDDVQEIGNQISEFEIVVADKVSTKEFDAQVGRIDNLITDNVLVKEELIATKATVSELEADNVVINETLTAREADIKKLQTEKLDAEIADIKYATIANLEAVNAEFHNLESTYGEFKDLTTDKLTALEAEIEELDVGTLTAEEADLKYANIDFSNIGKATMEWFYAQSGLIENVSIGDATITGNLVGVTIKGDLIEGGTVVADKLVVKGEDGLYYKLNTDGVTVETEQTDYNSLNGSIITANSITATKISVDDLVAFDATIGGFNITDSSLYSGVKESPDNTTRGVYLDSDGQIAFGDETNFVKFFKDTDGNYTLAISADSILFGAEKKGVDAAIVEATDEVREAMVDQSTTILGTCEELILTATENYVTVDEHDEFKQSVNAELSVMSDEIAMNFETTTTRLDDVDAELKAEVASRAKHISFSESGIKISAGENAMSITIDNDIVIFEKNGVQFGWWDGVDFHTGNIMIDVTERAQFGNFAFVPRTDGSLSFLKVAHNTGFYAVIRGGTMIIYGAYPTLEDATMVISDISGELTETTLTLGGS